MPTRRFIGVTATPSLVGVDAMLLEVDGQAPELAVRVLHHLTEPYGKELRELLIRVSSPEAADIRQVSLAHRLLGESFATAVRQLADQASVSLQSVLCIGCGGFLAWHEGTGRLASSLTLGAAGFVAERTGVTVITDFRTRDQACGGQGAPLSPIVDCLLFHDPSEDRLIVHLGGLAKVSVLPAGGDAYSALGWQAGPCNVLLDALIQQLTNGKERWDTGGRFAVQGRQIPELLERWLAHPFLVRRPPKSTHRSQFAEAFAKQAATLAQQMEWSHHDVLCTATHFVARSIGDSVCRYLPRQLAPARVILTGGGVRNGLLWRLIEEQLGSSRELTFIRSDTLGVPAEVMEAATAAVLACLLLDSVPASLPAVTGASGSRLLGSFTPGTLGNWSRCLAWMSGDQRSLLEED
jgi:anhydro-N-acetylmuramic acid kinase